MSSNPRRLPRIEWISSAIHPARKVAGPTLHALGALLGAATPSRPVPGPEPAARACGVPLDQLPALAEVGGVACVRPDGDRPVGIARVGRASFVGYRLGAEGLREVAVSYDAQHERLIIQP